MSLHHLHLRKRASGRAEHSYPAQTPGVKLLDVVIKIVAVISPAMMIPQILLIYTEKNADGIAPLSWFAFALFNIPWIIYGIVHKEKPLVLMYILWFICNVLVFTGALLY